MCRLAYAAHLQVLLNGSLERLGVGANDLADLFAILEQHKGGHGADAELLGDLGHVVDVELVEASVGVRVGEPMAASWLASAAEIMDAQALCDARLLFDEYCGLLEMCVELVLR